MPDDVVVNILDRLPLQEAVRTGILSKNWRFKWIMLSQLICDNDFFNYLKTKGENNYGRVISRLLLHLKGVITKFKLRIYSKAGPGSLEGDDINNWILFLARNGIKDLTYGNAGDEQLPTHVFSCLELTHLNLKAVYFSPPTSFQGFPNLLSLKFEDIIEFESGKLVQLFTKCPILEILNMGYYMGYHDEFNKVKVIEIAELTNLKILTLHLNNLDATEYRNSNSIFELVGFLPKLQELHLCFEECEPFTEDDAKTDPLEPFPALRDSSYHS